MVQIIKESRSHGIFAISQAVRTKVSIGSCGQDAIQNS